MNIIDLNQYGGFSKDCILALAFDINNEFLLFNTSLSTGKSEEIITLLLAIYSNIFNGDI